MNAKIGETTMMLAAPSIALCSSKLPFKKQETRSLLMRIGREAIA